MRSEVALASAPRFEARALGAQEELPGCPAASASALSPERLARLWLRGSSPPAGRARLCFGECHHPGGSRRRIAAIEVVRVRPRLRAGEPPAELIEDPW